VGVRILRRPDEVDQAWAALVAADEPRQLPDRSLTWRYLVERRMVGQEYSVEALVRDGEVVFENVTRKTVASGGAPVEVGHVVPAPLPDAGRARFARVLRELVAATGFGTGILHAEWMDTDDGLVLVECAGRIPGDQIIELIDLAYGMRLCHALTDLLRGRPVTLPRTARQAAAIRFLAPAPGRVDAVEGVDEVAARDEVEQVRVTVGPGDEVRPWRSSWDRVGHVLARATSPQQALAAAERAAADVRVLTDPRPSVAVAPGPR
jgi:biotin carboxylase